MLSCAPCRVKRMTMMDIPLRHRTKFQLQFNTFKGNRINSLYARWGDFVAGELLQLYHGYVHFGELSCVCVTSVSAVLGCVAILLDSPQIPHKTPEIQCNV